MYVEVPETNRNFLKCFNSRFVSNEKKGINYVKTLLDVLLTVCLVFLTSDPGKKARKGHLSSSTRGTESLRTLFLGFNAELNTTSVESAENHEKPEDQKNVMIFS